jgi:DNA-binding NtrC family response regulator
LSLWSHGAQSAVLRAVDERLITRLGAERELPLDCRVVFASNQPLAALVSSGRLLSDLRWRIGEFVIEIPPLAGRVVDVAALSYHFLDEARTEFGPGPVLFDPCALERLVTYHWPGNVRQLRGVVEWSWTLAAMDAVERIGLTHLPASVLRDEAARVPLDSSTRHALSRWAYDRAGRSRTAAGELLGLHPNTIDNHRRAATG